MAASVDYVRVVLLLQAACLLALYGATLVTLARKVWKWRAQGFASGQQRVALGRLSGYLGIVLLMVGAIQGYIELWGTPYSLRFLWVQIGYLLLLFYWGTVVRLFTVDRPFATVAEDSHA